jgi:amino acid adenylation domain-containing protein
MGSSSATEDKAPDDHEFWKGVLAAGAFVPIAHWAAELGRDNGRPPAHDVPVPAPVAAAIARVADELHVPVPALLLAAHAKVMHALSGDRAVVTGLRPDVPEPIEPLPCRVVVEDGVWRDLITVAAQAVDGVVAHRGFPVDDLRGDLGLPERLFETVLDVSGELTDPELPAGIVLCCEFHGDGDRTRLRLRYRPDMSDLEHAARVVGYYLTALRLMTEDPDAEHHRQSLLSAVERRFQLEELAGPSRELPDLRFHELFERRVREHPDAPAARCGTRTMTYDELNRRANRIANALLARGLRPEDVVAVVTERDLDWMAAVIAVLKAGGVYLPVEPRFPAERVATMLTRSECRLVLAERHAAANLEAAAVPGVEVIHLDAPSDELGGEADPGVAVAADQLAYIYFTSGSTGQPKGAMCEHAGMLNHLHAKIDDLGIGAGQVVAQTAPQCFDISLWQLLAAPLVGGSTLIVEQRDILDVERYLDTLVEGRVEVLQVVPSYLEVLLTHLERRPRSLGALRCVSATGEALKADLVRRWFASYPDIVLVNAYGLTETSDDTNHEVLDRAPDTDRVPVGRAVNNVSVYVVDEGLDLVPLGAPGEIVFAGVCVGRGYVNDEERTKAAFLPDPHRPGGRLYRSGDFGRWLSNGTLEFLGRRDAQVKIRGFRIEIGEIENQIMRIPGVRDAAVVIVGGTAGDDRQLVGFYSAGERVPVEDVRAALAERLPEYMVPAGLHRWDSLPLTGNGKIDKKALAGAAADLVATGATVGESPRTATERRLAAAWAAALRIPLDHVGRNDHFFNKGGTSLAAVRLVLNVDRLISLPDLTRAPVLAELAELIDTRPGARTTDHV